MISIQKRLVIGREIWPKPHDTWFYLYTGADKRTGVYIEVMARQGDVDMSPSFDKQIKKIIRYKLKHFFDLQSSK